KVLGTGMYDKFPWVPGMKPVSDDPVELLLNRTWRPTLSITGQAGLPDLVQGGNVLRPMTALKLSIRLAPSLDATNIDRKLKTLHIDYAKKITACVAEIIAAERSSS